MNRSSKAAAFHGSAQNPVYNPSERFRLAMVALELYGAIVEDLEKWCEQQDAFSKGESPTTASIRAILEKDDDALAGS